jgi:VanZ family protein
MQWIRAVWYGGAAAIITAIIYLSVTSNPLQLHVAQGDKLGHVAAYAVAAWWCAHMARTPGTRWTIAVCLIALGVALEFVQLQLGYRTFELKDMAADAMGVIIGSAVSLLWGPGKRKDSEVRFA